MPYLIGDAILEVGNGPVRTKQRYISMLRTEKLIHQNVVVDELRCVLGRSRLEEVNTLHIDLRLLQNHRLLTSQQSNVRLLGKRYNNTLIVELVLHLDVTTIFRRNVNISKIVVQCSCNRRRGTARQRVQNLDLIVLVALSFPEEFARNNF